MGAPIVPEPASLRVRAGRLTHTVSRWYGSVIVTQVCKPYGTTLLMMGQDGTDTV